jgi:hypothetical protein
LPFLGTGWEKFSMRASKTSSVTIVNATNLMAVVLFAAAVSTNAVAQPTPATATPVKPAATTPAATTPAATTPAATTPAVPPTGAGSGVGSSAAPPTVDPTKVAPEQMPDPVRIRRLEQRVQALKERAWRAKARVGMLKESVLGGGVGSQALILHSNDMGSSFRLVKLVYSLDGSQVFGRTDETAESMYKTKKYDIYAGPITPGSHSISVLAVYRGNGYGVFKYLNKYTFQVRSSHTFNAGEGRTTKIEASGYEKGGATTPMEKRPAIDFKQTLIAAEKPDAKPTGPAAAPAATTPTPAPGK